MAKSTGVVSDPLGKPKFWGSTEAPLHVKCGHEDYWAWGPDTAGNVRISGPLGETLHRVNAKTDTRTLVAMHLEDRAIVAKEREMFDKLASRRFKPIETKISRDTSLLGIHGVADGNEVDFIIHPAVATPLEALARQDVFLVLKDGKVIDVAAHAWPIDVRSASDFRSKLLAPVRYGDHIGVVAGCLGDQTVLKAESQVIVPMQDLDPVMVDTKLRKMIGGA